MTECKNCSATFEGKLCPNCSQKAETHRFTLGHFAHEVVHAVTHTDKGIFLLIKGMMVRPGVVVREFVEGKRKKYFNPFTFLLIMMAVQVFAVNKTNFFGKFTQQMQKLYEQIAAMDPKATNAGKEFNERMQKADKQVSFANENTKMVNFIFIPFLSLLTWLFFKRSGFNYAENLILNILIGGQMVVLFLVICILPVLLKASLVIIVMYLFIFVSFIYALITYKQFFRLSWGWTIFKGLSVQLIYLLVITFASEYLTKIFMS
jgi:hypothetical protein